MSIFERAKSMASSDTAKNLADSDTLKKMVAGESGEDPGLVGEVINMVKDPSNGGVSGLIKKFQENGLGDTVKSWAGSGGSHQISAEQVKKVLGEGRINAIASKFGMSADDACAKVANILPVILTKLMPGGAAAAAA